MRSNHSDCDLFRHRLHLLVLGLQSLRQARKGIPYSIEFREQGDSSQPRGSLRDISEPLIN